MRAEDVLSELKSKGNPGAVKRMARFGISSEGALGVSVTVLRGMAKRMGKDHALALELWGSGIHEARILAAMVDDPRMVTERQMEDWVADFDSWDVCDGCCGTLFDKTKFAYSKALEWSERGEEFVKRAGYALMAALAVHDKKAPDGAFLQFFSALEKGASDDRNFVKKAVNWALRQIGKRNRRLDREAMKLAWKLAKSESRSARWVASDAIRELRSDYVQTKVRRSS